MKDWQYWLIATLIAIAVFVAFTIMTNPHI